MYPVSSMVDSRPYVPSTSDLIQAMNPSSSARRVWIGGCVAGDCVVGAIVVAVWVVVGACSTMVRSMVHPVKAKKAMMPATGFMGVLSFCCYDFSLDDGLVHCGHFAATSTVFPSRSSRSSIQPSKQSCDGPGF